MNKNGNLGQWPKLKGLSYRDHRDLTVFSQGNVQSGDMGLPGNFQTTQAVSMKSDGENGYRMNASGHPKDREPILVIDLEATCWENSRLPDGERQSVQNMEIIEFGCALATRAGKLLDSRSFLVRPTRNPELSAFCCSLTGITQTIVDAAPTYSEVVRALDEWLGQPAESLIWCSWGNYDRHQIQAESEVHGIAPEFMTWPHLNLKRIWRRSTGQKKKTGLASALAFHNLAFEGRPHRGVDDARNIVRLLPFMDWALEPELLARKTLRADS